MKNREQKKIFPFYYLISPNFSHLKLWIVLHRRAQPTDFHEFFVDKAYSQQARAPHRKVRLDSMYGRKVSWKLDCT